MWSIRRDGVRLASMEGIPSNWHSGCNLMDFYIYVGEHSIFMGQGFRSPAFVFLEGYPLMGGPALFKLEISSEKCSF